ncbi:M20 family metallopeptidase [Chloroflexota bacterium]
MDTKELKIAIVNRVDSHQGQLEELSHKIHSNPELGFKEFKASCWLTGYLEENGFSVERGICGLATAFKASYGTGKPAIAILAEYDALPGLGHACGHNIISTSAVGAAVASREAVDRCGGTILVIGTPAEEMYGGKVIMSGYDTFNDADVAMMVHPAAYDVATIEALALQTLDIEFFGRAAHASAHPEEGINALEAMLNSFAAINSLRQHVKNTSRIHGIITDGGQISNVVPDHSAAEFIVRAVEADYLEELKIRVLNCFTGAAKASGARLKYKWSDIYYAPMRNNMVLARLFRGNINSLGHRMSLSNDNADFGSTDMGNVSQLVPGIHPLVAIAPPDVVGHSMQFTEAAISEAGMRGLIDAAKAMAMTVADLLADTNITARVIKEFRRRE